MATFCNEMPQNNEMMASLFKKDHKWRWVFHFCFLYTHSLSCFSLLFHIAKWDCFSAKKKGGDESVNTVESLRGRLLAERQCSRLAKQEAESMGDKVFHLISTSN